MMIIHQGTNPCQKYSQKGRKSDGMSWALLWDANELCAHVSVLENIAHASI